MQQKHQNRDGYLDGDEQRHEKVQKILESRGVGRPSGSYEDKKKQYLTLLNEGKIKTPKPKNYHATKLKKMLMIRMFLTK